MIDQTADESRIYTSPVAQEVLDQRSHPQNQDHHPCVEPMCGNPRTVNLKGPNVAQLLARSKSYERSDSSICDFGEASSRATFYVNCLAQPDPKTEQRQTWA